MINDHTTKRGQKAQLTKSRLIASALDLFSRQGYDSTSIKEIAHEAGVSLGLMYNYFPSKEDLLKQIIINETFILTLNKMVEDSPELDVKSLLLDISHRFYKFTGDKAPVIRLFLMEMTKNAEIAEIFSEFVHKEKEAFRKHLRNKIASKELREHDVDVTIHTLIHTILSMRIHQSVIDDPEAFLNSLVDILMNGISAK